MKRLLLLLVLLTSIGSCTPVEEVPPTLQTWDPALLGINDAGDEAWVKAVVPLIWGRLPRGTTEVRALVDVTDQLGRADTIRAMARSDEYVDRWQEFLLDALLIDRIGHDAKPDCFGVFSGVADDDSLAALVRDEAPDGEPYPDPWTMADLVRSSLRLDDLSPLFRANLVARLGQQFFKPAENNALAYRQDKVEVFLTSYIGRQMQCLGCHNPEFSVTDHPDPALDRHWELPGLPEKALFGASEGNGEEELLQVFFRRFGVEKGSLAGDFGLLSPEALFDGCSVLPGAPAGCEACSCAFEVCNIRGQCCGNTWDQTCADLCVASEVGCAVDVPAGFAGCQGLPGAVGCPECGCEAAVCTEDPSCCTTGWTDSCADLCFELGNDCVEAVDGYAPWGMDAECPQFAPIDLVEPDIFEQTGYFITEHDLNASIWDLQAYLTDGFEAMRGSGPTVADNGDMPPTEAFAWMVSMRLSDRVWNELYGRPLTIAHNFPRNRYQRDQLAALVDVFMVEGYSLRELLVAGFTHPAFNQRAPVDVQDTDSGYYMAPLVDPWTVEAVDATARGNGSGDLVHVRPPRVLLGVLTSALEWSPAVRFPDVSEQYQTDTQRRMGVQLAVAEQGVVGSDFQSLVAWEWLFGGCRTRNGEMEPANGSQDWVDRLMEAAEDSDATIGEVLSALKDRLLTDPRIDAAEEARLEDVVGAAFGDSVQGREEGIRRVCGVFLATPWFRLTGLPSEDSADQSPALVVPGSSFEDVCEALSDSIFSGDLDCSDGRARLP